MPFLESHQTGQAEFHSLTTGFVVGRGDDVDLQLADPSCSREHFQLERRSGDWAVVDLGSANGTTVNGQLVSRLTVREGDVIQCGATRLVFRRTAPAPALVNPEEESTLAAPSSSIGESPRRRRVSTPVFLMLMIVVLSVLGYLAMPDTENSGDPIVTSDQEGASNEESLSNGASNPVTEDSLSAEEKAELKARREYRAAVKAMRADAIAMADRHEWVRALDLTDEWLLRAAESGERHRSLKVRRVRVEVLKRLQTTWDKSVSPFRETLRSGDIDGARVKLEELRGSFADTPMGGRIDSEASLLELKLFLQNRSTAAEASEAAKAVAGAASEDPPSARTPATDARWLLATAAAARADWAEASGLARKVLSGGSAPESMTQRAQLYSAHADLRQSISDALGDGGGGLSRFSVGRTSVLPTGADEKGIELEVGSKGNMRWNWNGLRTDRLLRLYRAVARTPRLRVALAIVQDSLGQREKAMATLARAARNRDARSLVNELVAKWRGVPVPSGGFVVDGKRFLTPAEHEAEETARRATRLARNLKRAKLSRYREVVAELQAMGDPAREPLIASLKLKVDALFEQTSKVGTLGNLGSTRNALSARLKLLRAEALALIFDRKRYPYPYGPDQEKVQAEVDRLTDRVKGLYFHPARYLFEMDKALNAHIEFWAEVSGDLAELTRETSDTAAIFAHIDKLVDFPRHADSSKHVQKNKDIQEYNLKVETTAKPEEREVVRLTNVYRMTMGLTAVKIAEPLIQAARGHSTEMQERGYFSHTSPVKGRTRPSDRARLAGWGGGVSENIARGSSTPQGAVNGWIHSSGHHRNILGRGWVHLGAGLSPKDWFWTQNFGG